MVTLQLPNPAEMVLAASGSQLTTVEEDDGCRALMPRWHPCSGIAFGEDGVPSPSGADSPLQPMT